MEEWIKENISLKVEEDIGYIKELLQNNSDVVYREFYICNWKAAFIYIDGMADKVLLDDFVLEPLMEGNRKIEKIEDIKDKILAVSDIREVNKLSEGINAMLSGDTLMLINGLGAAYVIASRSWPVRGVGEPSGETVIRGAREGFTETIRFNTVLVRRRIRDTRLKVIPKSIGKRSKTDTAMMYIDDIVNQDVLNELNTRLDRIDIDAILDSGYVEQMIEDNRLSPFPQIQSTERPDVVAAALYEGRIAMLVDNSPFAIIVPATLPNLLQSPDDYYQRWLNSSIVRCTRFIAILLAVLLPGLYVAITSFHTSIIPTELAYSIAGSREGVPFPAYIEALIMEISLALLLEAIVRLPKPVGATIGIVGGLIIGQAAVSAGIVSPIMIIIVGITAITEFITPNYSLSFALRIVRFMTIIASAIMGLYGIMIVVLLLLIHLIRLKSFGIPYLAPVVNPNIKDFKDMYVRLPFMFFKERPKYMKTKDKIRQK
ncbi:spore germination protein [Clostridium sp. MB40-C1]|uniref:spore germination protein n=1 Tax=Clostridium sp. MB40-C1 TaxID=3070996 RepID=UPI0027DF3618|nr:spore germination protein [Clostridium sp. MB40-C1]WMJ79704.1 spore germination protein [Clostridium sp. MB40-C1]